LPEAISTCRYIASSVASRRPSSPACNR
jgi:hypothetical protein